MKTVTIIIPAKNEEKYLPLCLESIQKLDYPRDALEVIVVDNGSTDRTREIAQSFGALVLRDDTKHVSGLRNLGADRAKGEILAFVDADCVVAPDWLQAASQYFDNNDVVAWGGPPVPPDDASWVQKTWFLMTMHKKEVKRVDWLGTVDLFVRQQQFMEAGKFEETLITCEDVDFCYRIGKKGEIISDTKIKILHLRDADTLSAFFRKELWRGKSNFQGIGNHGLTWKELPSLGVPVYFIVIIALSTYSALFASPFLFYVLVLLLFPGFLMVSVRNNKPNIDQFIKSLVLINVYFLARTLAIFGIKKS